MNPRKRKADLPVQNAEAGHGEGQTADMLLGSLLEQDDRRRLDLAQRLHKEIAGNLVACTSVTEMLRQQVAKGGGMAVLTRMLDQLDEALRLTIQDVRELTVQQFPPVLKAFGLKAALQELVEDVKTRFEGTLDLNFRPDDLALEPGRQLNLYRLLEALIARCAHDPQASEIRVSVDDCNGLVEVSVEHDGDSTQWAAGARSDGLCIIQARCALLGARLQSDRNAGTKGLRVSFAFATLPQSQTEQA